MTPGADTTSPWPALRHPVNGRLRTRLLANGALGRLHCGDVSLTLFPGTELESGPANLVLRCHHDEGGLAVQPLLGPGAPGRWRRAGARGWFEGQWRQIAYRVELVLASGAMAWFWHVELTNRGPSAQRLDLVYLQDVALAPWDALRLNEAYVSQYIDHQPLEHEDAGTLIASRQNAAVLGRTPWLLSGSLNRCVAFATDALQVLGLARRAGVAAGLLGDVLPAQRLQHEHSLVALQDQAFTLEPGAALQRGFFGWFEEDHAQASAPTDLALRAQVMALPESRWTPLQAVDEIDTDTDTDSITPGLAGNAANLFSSAPLFSASQPGEAELARWFGVGWRHVERSADGVVLSFFGEQGCHVVTRAKELAVLRPHGHLMRSGRHWTPDETAITTTAWMAGVFNSSLTQGHASANRCLSTQRGYLGLYRALGQRLFVDTGGGWWLLDLPSAMQISPQQCRWFYRDAASLIVISTRVAIDTPELTLTVELRQGPPARLLLAHHVALNGDDGLDELPACWAEAGAELLLRAAPGSAMRRRFPNGGLRLRAGAATPWLHVGGDERLFADGRSRGLPWLCLEAGPTKEFALTIVCNLIAPAADTGMATDALAEPHADEAADAADAADAAAYNASTTGGLQLWPARSDGAGLALLQLAEQLPWLAHNALVHYLAPRGLEQFSGGGWGTRDVSQGPAELLLALGRFDALRDLLTRLFSAQNADGDWPQWFMFFDRDAAVRADDSHGDIVCWPLVALADYLVASGDDTLLDELRPFHPAPGQPVEWASIAGHVDRALGLIARRTIAGTRLLAYGHGDWNDALQPADPAMREHLCSAWTVTLHYRMLRSLAAAWTQLGRLAQADAWLAAAAGVLDDFQRLLVVDGVVTGYASFEHSPSPECLLHPRDAKTGIHYSALPMVHAIIDELFTPEQAQSHRLLIEQQLSGPDGLRLFDRPLRYRGGPQRLFQRGESASYFGREIGLMYMHAHLRWAEALARLGRADDFFHALRLANPIAIETLVPAAARRQSNCYHSSSDARFADRHQAWADYDRIARGEVALEGGWRVYSSGAGIAFRLVVQCLLGLTQQQHRLLIDPVLPQALDGLRAGAMLYGRQVELLYHVGPLGHGPHQVTLDGEALATTPAANRYRRAGVVVDAGPLQARLARPGVHRIEVWLG